jgi:hypothetical protein
MEGEERKGDTQTSPHHGQTDAQSAPDSPVLFGRESFNQALKRIQRPHVCLLPPSNGKDFLQPFIRSVRKKRLANPSLET